MIVHMVRARWWHLGTTAAALFGLVVQLVLVVVNDASVWNYCSYFTIWSNVLVAVVSSMLARDPARRGDGFAVLAFATVACITVTGAVYAIVLAPLWSPTGWQKAADDTLHYVVPVLAVLGYLLFGPRPRFSWAVLVRSLAVPAVWLAYTLIRGPVVDWYPYHFIDVERLGYGQALLNSAGVLLLLLVVGAGYVVIDRWLPRRPA
jgi:hypothetical protein